MPHLAWSQARGVENLLFSFECCLTVDPTVTPAASKRLLPLGRSCYFLLNVVKIVEIVIPFAYIEVSCYFLLNVVKKIVEDMIKEMPVDLLFSFECCLKRIVTECSSNGNGMSCYFLLNVVQDSILASLFGHKIFAVSCYFLLNVVVHHHSIPRSLRRYTSCYFLLNVVKMIEERSRSSEGSEGLAIFF